uniref:Intersectin 1 (SH3 domain protein) n=1 Tax=Ciona savignyi TaxID=51511 RepID=H2YB78_CIOSA
QWVITADERRNYDTQFNNLMPVAGFLSGDQARNFLLQCNLPPVILGRIWWVELADITGDGKMDKHEFAIAMKLIKMKLQGVELPLALPQSMKPTGFGAPGLMNTGFGTNVPNGRSTPGYPAASISPLSESDTASPQMTPKTSLSRHSSLNEGSSRKYFKLSLLIKLSLLDDISNFMVGYLITMIQLCRIPSLVCLYSGRVAVTFFPLNIVVANPLKRTQYLHRPGQEWAIPKHTKLKYNQLFNSNDRTKTGYMSGRRIMQMVSFGNILLFFKNIWQLSDIDNDGKLSQEEFVLAMHLTDVAKSGELLWLILLNHIIKKGLIIGNMQIRVIIKLYYKKDSVMDGGGVFASFEDRRRENFQKGNLELEKRRIALLESQQKEKHRIEQQERDIREKREKERQEQERKRQEEIERQREQLRAVEREREEQKRKALEQKESAQREMERQRQLEWERLRRKELLQLKLREQESVTSLRAKTKTLDVELNTLLEKRKQLQARAQDFESRLREQNMELEAVNKQRELKHTLVQRQQEQIQHIQQQLNAMHPEKQSLSERIQ